MSPSRVVCLLPGLLLACEPAAAAVVDAPTAIVGDGGSESARDAGDEAPDAGPSVLDASPEPADATTDPDPCASGAICGGDGLCEPTPLCTPEAPCSDALVGLGTGTLAEPLTLPVCATTARDRARFDDGAPREWLDASSGQPRAACVFRPSGELDRPLVVFLHGSGGSASSIYDNTSLRTKAETYDLSGSGAPGFVLVADQGPNTTTNLSGNPPAARHEVDFFDYGVPSENPDFRNLDRLIDELVAEGGIDARRIYVVGWSNGLQFAILYGLARHSTPTPGGNRVAAIAGFEAGDPTRPKADPRCLGRYPEGAAPVLMVHRACSIVPCDRAQAEALDLEENTDGVGAFMERLGARGIAEAITIDAGGRRVDACAATCTRAMALIGHARWPDGVADGGDDHELAMLAFLRDNPLRSP